METEHTRLQGCADKHLRDNLPRPESCTVRDAFIDAGIDDSEVTDEEIKALGREWALDRLALITRLRKFIADSEVM